MIIDIYVIDIKVLFILVDRFDSQYEVICFYLLKFKTCHKL